MSSRSPKNKGVGDGLSVDIQSILATAADVQQLVSHGINPDGSLRPEAMRALLKLKGVNLKAFAETNGFMDPTVHQVINREFSNETIENLLAELLGLDAGRIWGRRPSSAA